MELQEGDALVRIALPLPMDVSAGVLRGLGELYPNAVLVTDKGDSQVMAIRIPAKDRGWDDGDEDCENCDGVGVIPDPNHDLIDCPNLVHGRVALRAAARLSQSETEAFVTSLRDGSFGMSAPEWASRTFVSCFKAMLDDSDAPNYVECQMFDPETEELYSFMVMRPGGATPHQLREAAEARATVYAEALRGVGINPDTL